jgi:hypothetical protein
MQTPTKAKNSPTLDAANFPNKENFSSPIKGGQLSMCLDYSGTMKTSYTPDTMVQGRRKLETPRSVYATPKSSFATPKTILSERNVSIHFMKIDDGTPTTTRTLLETRKTMHLIDLTTPQVNRKQVSATPTSVKTTQKASTETPKTIKKRKLIDLTTPEPYRTPVGQKVTTSLLKSALKNTAGRTTPQATVTRTVKKFSLNESPIAKEVSTEEKKIPLPVNSPRKPIEATTVKRHSCVAATTPISARKFKVHTPKSNGQKLNAISEKKALLIASSFAEIKIQRQILRTPSSITKLVTTSKTSDTGTSSELFSMVKKPVVNKKLLNTPDMRGVKRLMQTPGKQEAKNDLTNVEGIKRLMKTPGKQSTKDDLNQLSGVKRLMKTPEKQQKDNVALMQTPDNNLQNDVEGVERLMSSTQELLPSIDETEMVETDDNVAACDQMNVTFNADVVENENVDAISDEQLLDSESVEVSSGEGDLKQSCSDSLAEAIELSDSESVDDNNVDLEDVVGTASTHRKSKSISPLKVSKDVIVKPDINEWIEDVQQQTSCNATPDKMEQSCSVMTEQLKANDQVVNEDVIVLQHPRTPTSTVQFLSNRYSNVTPHEPLNETAGDEMSTPTQQFNKSIIGGITKIYTTLQTPRTPDSTSAAVNQLSLTPLNRMSISSVGKVDEFQASASDTTPQKLPRSLRSTRKRIGSAFMFLNTSNCNESFNNSVADEQDNISNTTFTIDENEEAVMNDVEAVARIDAISNEQACEDDVECSKQETEPLIEEPEVEKIEIISSDTDIGSQESAIALSTGSEMEETPSTEIEQSVVDIDDNVQIIGTPIRKSSRRRSLTPSKSQPIAVASRKTPRKANGKLYF